jgi:hypothetical protein
MSMMDESKQMKELMFQVFPGYEDFGVDSVTPSISGKEPVVSFLVVCNDEVSHDFLENQDISVEVIASSSKNKLGQGKDLHLRFDFTFPVFSLQFFAVVEGGNAKQQRDFASALLKVDFFIVWLVNQEKNLLKVLKVQWDKNHYEKILEDLLENK